MGASAHGEPIVRIHLPPAGSLQTLGPAARAAFYAYARNTRYGRASLGHVNHRHGQPNQLLLQHVAYLAAQGIDCEWLGQQLDTRIE
jgi:hypothetical protein